MKKLLAALLFCVAFVTTSNATVLTGTLNKPDGTGFTGTLYLSIAQQVGISSGGTCGGPVLVSPTVQVVVNVVNGTMTNPPTLYGGECTLPQSMPYNAVLKDPNGNTMFQTQWLITGTTQDVGTVYQGPAQIPPSALILQYGLGNPPTGVACSATTMYVQSDAPAGTNLWPCINGQFVNQGGGVGTSLSINIPVAGSAASAPLYVSPTGTLVQDSANYIYNQSTHTLAVTNLAVTNPISGNLAGNSATTTKLAGVPAICGSGQFPQGVDQGGNALNCATPSGTGVVIPNVTTLIAGNGSGGASDSTITPSNVALRSASNTFTGSNQFGANSGVASQTAATGSANSNSPAWQISGNYWNGSSSANDTWAMSNVLGSGTNPTSVLTLGHSGTSGVASVSIPYPTQIGSGANFDAAGDLTTPNVYVTGLITSPAPICIGTSGQLIQSGCSGGGGGASPAGPIGFFQTNLNNTALGTANFYGNTGSTPFNQTNVPFQSVTSNPLNFINGPNTYAAGYTNCTQTQTVTQLGSEEHDCNYMNFAFFGKGRNNGNDGSTTELWYVSKGINIDMKSYSNGISQAIGMNNDCTGKSGDCAALYIQSLNNGGYQATSDEGTPIATFKGGNTAPIYGGLAPSTVSSPTSLTLNSAYNTPMTDNYIADFSEVVTSGHIIGTDGSGHPITDTTHTQTPVQGLTTTAITAFSPITVSATLSVGSTFLANKTINIVCESDGSLPESVTPTAVTSATFTATFQNGHASGCKVFQGTGVQTLDLVADRHNNSNGQTWFSQYVIFGYPTTTTIYVVNKMPQGLLNAIWPLNHNFGFSLTGVSLSRTGGTVTACPTKNNYNFSGQQISVTSASPDTSLNIAAVQASNITPAGCVTWSQSGANTSGAQTATLSTGGAVDTGTLTGTGSFYAYQAARINSVGYTTTTNADGSKTSAYNGTINLDANDFNITAGNGFLQSSHPNNKTDGIDIFLTFNTPATNEAHNSVLSLFMDGNGENGNIDAVSLQNTAPWTNFLGGGGAGQASAPNFVVGSGPFTNEFIADAPLPGGCFICSRGNPVIAAGLPSSYTPFGFLEQSGFLGFYSTFDPANHVVNIYGGARPGGSGASLNFNQDALTEYSTSYINNVSNGGTTTFNTNGGFFLNAGNNNVAGAVGIQFTLNALGNGTNRQQSNTTIVDTVNSGGATNTVTYSGATTTFSQPITPSLGVINPTVSVASLPNSAPQWTLYQVYDSNGVSGTCTGGGTVPALAVHTTGFGTGNWYCVGLSTTVNGTGTFGYIPEWTGTTGNTTIGNSPLDFSVTASGMVSTAYPFRIPSYLATGTTSNTDLAGRITLSGGTGSYTFASAHTNAPVCVANDNSAAQPVQTSATATTLTLTGTGTDTVSYVCIVQN